MYVCSFIHSLIYVFLHATCHPCCVFVSSVTELSRVQHFFSSVNQPGLGFREIWSWPKSASCNVCHERAIVPRRKWSSACVEAPEAAGMFMSQTPPFPSVSAPSLGKNSPEAGLLTVKGSCSSRVEVKLHMGPRKAFGRDESSVPVLKVSNMGKEQYSHVLRSI